MPRGLFPPARKAARLVGAVCGRGRNGGVLVGHNHCCLCSLCSSHCLSSRSGGGRGQARGVGVRVLQRDLALGQLGVGHVPHVDRLLELGCGRRQEGRGVLLSGNGSRLDVARGGALQVVVGDRQRELLLGGGLLVLLRRLRLGARRRGDLLGELVLVDARHLGHLLRQSRRDAGRRAGLCRHRVRRLLVRLGRRHLGAGPLVSVHGLDSELVSHLGALGALLGVALHGLLRSLLRTSSLLGLLRSLLRTRLLRSLLGGLLVGGLLLGNLLGGLGGLLRSLLHGLLGGPLGGLGLANGLAVLANGPPVLGLLLGLLARPLRVTLLLVQRLLVRVGGLLLRLLRALHLLGRALGLGLVGLGLGLILGDLGLLAGHLGLVAAHLLPVRAELGLGLGLGHLGLGDLALQLRRAALLHRPRLGQRHLALGIGRLLQRLLQRLLLLADLLLVRLDALLGSPLERLGGLHLGLVLRHLCRALAGLLQRLLQRLLLLLLLTGGLLHRLGVLLGQLLLLLRLDLRLENGLLRLGVLLGVLLHRLGVLLGQLLLLLRLALRSLGSLEERRVLLLDAATLPFALLTLPASCFL